MPPKPRPIRKPSNAAKHPPVKVAVATNPPSVDKARADTAAAAMPPPPQPQPPKAILEAEFDALAAALKAATVKTAQIYAFHADARRLNLPQARHPPRSLTMALGHEVEKYDQLCDVIEAQLHRAIAVLQRDLTKEEQRLKAKATAISSRTRSKTPSSSPTASRISLPPVPGSSSPGTAIPGVKPDSASMPPPEGSPVQSTVGDQMSPPIAPARRASVISLSTLQRPFPLRLDLSSSALRIGADEFIHPLASPVTLAPRSARPGTAGGELGDLPPDLLAMVEASAANVSNMPSAPMAGPGADIDLSMSDPTPVDIDLTMPSPSHGGDTGLGNSADKPIELDLDMEMEMDLFGDDLPQDSIPAPTLNEEHDILQSLSGGADTTSGEDIFGSLATAESEAGMSDIQGQAGASGSNSLPDFGDQAGAGPSEEHEETQFDLGGLDLTNLDANFFNDASINDVDAMSVDDFLKMGGAGEDEPTN